MKKTVFLSLSLFLFMLLSVGCQSDTTIDDVEPNTTNQTNEQVSGYPVSEAESITDGYPSPSVATNTTESYPLSVVSQQDESLRFLITEPVFEGSSSVLGTGVAATPIRIASISNVGETLGLGLVGSDGLFDISLSRPLNERETVAIMLQDGVSQSDFLDSPGATDIPMIGFILDMAIAETP